MSFPLVLPSEIQLQQIYNVLGVDEARHQHLLNRFKNWLSTEKYLPQEFDEAYLSNFLLLCKDDLSKAKIKFETNLINRSSQLLSKMKFKPGIIDFNVIRQSLILPYLTENGCRLVFCSIPEVMEEFNLISLLNYALNLTDILLFEDNCSGAIIIIDFKNSSAEIVTKVDFSTFVEFMKFLLSSFPHRLKNFHIINCKPIIKPGLILMKSVLTDKLKNRFLIHNQPEDLLNYLPITHLPIECGGNSFSLNDLANNWKKYFQENHLTLTSKLSKVRVQGQIPKEKMSWDSSFSFGLDGSFRNLQVD
ncbi:alpha-tocopherol transfer protein-like [Onthophagus taurus]|uniref:alpha-tocopherol transfer protein-like n=1 Tax=Onthophagus taurus TaxID=166361 RepID=UPI0039BDB824